MQESRRQLAGPRQGPCPAFRISPGRGMLDSTLPAAARQPGHACAGRRSCEGGWRLRISAQVWRQSMAAEFGGDVSGEM